MPSPGVQRPGKLARVMERQDVKVMALGTAVMLCYGSVVLSLVSDTPFAAAVFGCLAIVLTVKWVNDRQDPRHQKRPPDPP